jgi:Outer membrane protein beta-barrel domain
MRVYSIVLCLVLGSATVAAAQQPAVGVKAGFNVANVQYEGEDANVNLDRRTGFVGGLFLLWPVDTRLALQLEALYSQKGATFDQGVLEGKAKIDFVDVPILLRVSSARSG